MSKASLFDIRISPNPPVFDLPLLVAREFKLFEKHGINLSYAANYSDREQIESQKSSAAAGAPEGIALQVRQGGRV